MKKRVLSLLIALLCLLFAQAQAANTCSHPVDQREPTMVQYSRTVGGVRQLVHGNQCRVCKALVDYGPCTTRPGARPTCTETGLTEGTHCAVCSAVLTAQQTIDARGHWYGEWSPCGDGTHAARCQRSGCAHEAQAACQTLTAQMAQGEARFCPICGEVENGSRLALIQGAQVQAKRPPAGEAIVRQGNGVVSVTFARQGRLSRLYAPATVILPFETSQGTEIVLDFSPDELPVCVVK